MSEHTETDKRVGLTPGQYPAAEAGKQITQAQAAELLGEDAIYMLEGAEVLRAAAAEYKALMDLKLEAAKEIEAIYLPMLDGKTIRTDAGGLYYMGAAGGAQQLDKKKLATQLILKLGWDKAQVDDLFAGCSTTTKRTEYPVYKPAKD